jgi:membrane-associated phospholipid phosphatase
VLFFLLGTAVSHRGEPALLLSWEHSLFDQATPLAWRLTQSCYPMILIPICIVLLVVALLLRAWRVRMLTSIVSLLVSWRAADFFQHYFGRPRPVDWVVKHELTFSYPSSHAAIAFGFWGLWAALIYYSDLPKPWRLGGAALLAIFALAICWSRLALGAHYLTDLVGGALLGVTVAVISVAVVVAFFGRVAGSGAPGKNRAA